MSGIHLNPSDQKRWDSIKEAFHEDCKCEAQKSAKDRFKEAVANPFHFAKGVAQGSLRLLENGVAPIVHTFSEGYRLIKSPRGYWTKKKEEQKVLQSKIKDALEHPRNFLRRLTERVKDQITQQAIKFLKASEADRAESVGKLAPDLALLYLGGEAYKARRFVGDLSEVSRLRPLPFGFKTFKELGKFGATIKEGLEAIGVTDAQIFLRGSSVTGTSFRTGLAFDVGRMSDFDVAISSESLFNKAKSVGIHLRSKGTRTAPLLRINTDQLSLTNLAEQLNKGFGHPVSFMIYQSPQNVFLRGPYLPVP